MQCSVRVKVSPARVSASGVRWVTCVAVMTTNAAVSKVTAIMCQASKRPAAGGDGMAFEVLSRPTTMGLDALAHSSDASAALFSAGCAAPFASGRMRLPSVKTPVPDASRARGAKLHCMASTGHGSRPDP